MTRTTLTTIRSEAPMRTYDVAMLTSEEWARSKSVTDGMDDHFGYAMRDAVPWLGQFSMSTWGNYRGRGRPVPAILHTICTQMIQAAVQWGWDLPRPGYTTVFVQRYEPGSSVSPHRDPADNLHSTLILSLGDYEGPQHTIERETFAVRPGAVLRLPCSQGGVRGPRHSVSPVTRGVRWAVILNQIEREEAVFPSP
jgi:hypothetical protein